MILGIESSCDESALALFDAQQGVVGEWIHSQIAQHAEYGGIVPDIAVRQHLDHFFPLLDQMRKHIDINGEISEIAVTCGPGLIGCLGVGLSIAKTLGAVWRVPVVGVNHLRGHAYSSFMSLGSHPSSWETLLPHLGLLVSGGNTLLFEIGADRTIKIIGRTTDDAVGEALDKGAKLLGFPYPGAAALEKCARAGNPKAFLFPRAFQSKRDHDFSFSGLKTSLLYQLQKMSQNEVEQYHQDLCASYQEAAIDQLAKKCLRFLDRTNYKSFGLSGGVANNDILRNRLKQVCIKQEVEFLAAEKKYTGDNAAMIAYVAHHDRVGLWSNRGGILNFNPSLSLDAVPSID
ncbi:MAG: tRNA (adenosine(37)-N6)-threonylcarbamoyltransferase complex transferase subunit TsaD [Opitutae bacterium]